MSIQKIKDLCMSISRPARQGSPYDMVATKIFSPIGEHNYIQSSARPDTRYAVSLDKSAAEFVNDRFLQFRELFGPGEQFLINKIFNQPNGLLFIVGGVGVGKSTFVSYLERVISPLVDAA